MIDMTEDIPFSLPTIDTRSSLHAAHSAIFRARLFAFADSVSFETDWLSPTPIVPRPLLATLSDLTVEHFVGLGILKMAAGNVTWNYQPVIGNELILFKDLRCRRLLPSYVWLRSNPSSKSWRFIHHFAIKQSERLIDLGSGTGLNALQAARYCREAVGIDNNPRAVQLASFNAAFNSITNSTFHVSDMKTARLTGYDVIVSQPPFDPDLSISRHINAFTGGDVDGLGLTRSILMNKTLTAGQRVILYVHSFTHGRVPTIQHNLSDLYLSSCQYTILEVKHYSLSTWWNSFCKRYNLSPHVTPPRSLLRFDGVSACIVSVYVR